MRDKFREHLGGARRVVDYFLWALQRFYERREDRFSLEALKRSPGITVVFVPRQAVCDILEGKEVWHELARANCH